MKTQNYVFLSFLLFTIVSCTVDVPDEIPNSQEPQFSFTVEGDGFSHTFTESDDFDSFQLNLKESVTYDFTLSGSDDNALKNLLWTFPGSLNLGTELFFSEELPLGWRETSRYYEPDYIDGIRFEGTIENPTPHIQLNGKFNIYGYQDLVYFYNFSATDYGDAYSDENISEGRLRIKLVSNDQPTELVPID